MMYRRKEAPVRAEGVRRWLAVAAVAGVLVLSAAPALAAAAGAEQGEPQVAAEKEPMSDASLYIGAFAAASFCVAVSVIGAAWAVAKVGTAAMGAVAEKPELMGRSMVYVGLAEGLAIYGLIVAIMILGRLPG